MREDTLEIGIRPPTWIDLDIDSHEITGWVVRAEEHWLRLGARGRLPPNN